jgi:hypothetical protein
VDRWWLELSRDRVAGINGTEPWISTRIQQYYIYKYMHTYTKRCYMNFILVNIDSPETLLNYEAQNKFY